MTRAMNKRPKLTDRTQVSEHQGGVVVEYARAHVWSIAPMVDYPSGADFFVWRKKSVISR